MLGHKAKQKGYVVKKRDWAKWNAISDMVETVAVVISLLFVAFSINHNSEILQSANDNFVYQIQDERVRDIAINSELASIELKVRNSEEISEVDKHRMLSQHLRELNMWEVAFVRHNQGMYSREQWQVWNRYYVLDLIDKLPKDWWAEVKPWFGDDFASHVDAAYTSR